MVALATVTVARPSDPPGLHNQRAGLGDPVYVMAGDNIVLAGHVARLLRDGKLCFVSDHKGRGIVADRRVWWEPVDGLPPDRMPCLKAVVPKDMSRVNL